MRTPHQPIRPNPRRRPAIESLERRTLMATTVFQNTTAMNIQADFNPPTEALNYPTIINVDSITGPITELRVHLYGVYHDQPADLDVLIYSPTGRSMLVMSDAGGTADIPADDYINLTFFDAAARSLPLSTRIDAGQYRPTNYDNDDFFEDNELFNAPTHSTLADLTVGNPNGEWKCYVVDDTAGNLGGIGFGWGLTFVTGGPGPAAPSTPDMITASDRGASSTDNITNVDTPRFSGTGPAGTQLRLFVDGVAQPGTVTVAANGTYLVQAQSIPSGTHTVSVRALDAQGTEGPSSGELSITIDIFPPDYPGPPDLTAASDTGASNTDNDTNDNTPTFTGIALGATTVQLFANDVVVGSAPVVNNTYNVTPTTPMEPGTYGFSVLISDVAGNVGGPSDPLNVIIRPGGTTTYPISSVYVRGSDWLGQDSNATTTNFMEYLEGKGLGDDVYGFRVDNAPADTILPWINLNQIVLRYATAPTGAAIPTVGTLTLAGQRSPYLITNVAVVAGDATTYMLSLNKPLGGGNPVTGVAPSTDENGDQVTLGVPGGGAGGANYSLRMQVLQGDTDHLDETSSTHAVLARDFAEVKKRFFKDTTSAVVGDGADYSAFHDVDGSGSILARDFAEVKKRFFQALPVPTASAAGTFSATRVADDVLA